MQKFSKFGMSLAILAITALTAQATTIDLTVGTAGAGYANRDSGNQYVIEQTFDVTNALNATTNTLELLQITAGTTVHDVGYEIVTALTNATYTINVGDGTTAAGWISAGAVTSGAFGASSPSTITATPTFQTAIHGTNNQVVVTNGTVAITVSPTYGLGKLYAADDTIDAAFNAGPGHTGRVRVWAIVSDHRATSGR